MQRSWRRGDGVESLPRRSAKADRKERGFRLRSNFDASTHSLTIASEPCVLHTIRHEDDDVLGILPRTSQRCLCTPQPG